jgi:hypothetical protein
MQQTTAGAVPPRVYIGVGAVALPSEPGRPISYAVEVREGFTSLAQFQDYRLGGGDQWGAGLDGILCGLDTVTRMTDRQIKAVMVVCPGQAMADAINLGLPTWRANGWARKDGSSPAYLDLLQRLDAQIQNLQERGIRVHARDFGPKHSTWRKELHDRARAAGRGRKRALEADLAG